MMGAGWSRIAAGGGALLAAAAGPGGAALAQDAPPPLAAPAPNYVSIVLDIDVVRPAAAAWARVGKYCDISEWFAVPCVVTSGKDGQLGAVRTIRGSTLEVLVARTALSYTYAQPVRVGVPYNLYHGTLEARPVTPTASKLVYSLVFDNSLLADDAARAADRLQRTARCLDALRNMKILAEGGALPAPAPAAAGPR